MKRNLRRTSELLLHKANEEHNMYDRPFFSKSWDIYFFLFCLVFVILLLILPSFVKYINNGEIILLSSQSYSHLRLAEYIQEKGHFPSYDWLSFAGINFKFTSVYEFVLAFFSNIFGISLFYIVLFLPIFFGILFYILLYILLIELKTDVVFKRIFCLLLITSPLFLYLFSVSNYFYIPLFLILFSIVLFLSHNAILRSFSYVLLLVMPFFGYVFPILSIFVLMLLYVKFRRRTCIFLVIILFLSSFFYISEIINLIETWNFLNILNYSFLLTDFGYPSGFSLFSLMLFIVGLIYVSKKNKEKKGVLNDSYVFLILLLSIVLFLFLNMETLFFVNFIVIFYAAYGFLYLIQFEYESSIIRYITIVILLSTAIFIPISYINHMHSFYPDKEIVSAFTYLGTLDDYQYAVFSYGKHGTLINAIAKRPNIIDDYYFYLPKYLERRNEMTQVYYTRDISLADSFFQKYNIRYVFIDSQMKKEIWIHDNQGLLFLLKSSDRFEKIYNSANVVIYRYQYNYSAVTH